jgi:hypothetical protein
LVREGFTLERGQKIGIVVSMPPHDTLHSALRKLYPRLETTMLDNIFGICGDRATNVYTREITDVGDSHIEYDTNSFEGCSGAIVFLLDKQQPEPVQETDYAYAIAVHAGAHPYYDRNLSFLLSSIL